MPNSLCRATLKFIARSGKEVLFLFTETVDNLQDSFLNML